MKKKIDVVKPLARMADIDFYQYMAELDRKAFRMIALDSTLTLDEIATAVRDEAGRTGLSVEATINRFAFLLKVGLPLPWREKTTE